MTDKQFMEQLAAAAETLTAEQKAYILGAARGMRLTAQTEDDKNPDEDDGRGSVQ